MDGVAASFQSLGHLYQGAFRCFPAYPEIKARNIQWIEDFKLSPHPKAFRNFLKIDCAALSCFAFHYGDPHLVQLGADFIAWLFIFDDFYGEALLETDASRLRDFYSSLVEAAAHRLPKDATAFHHSIADIAKRGAIAGPTWREQFANSLESYFAGCASEYRYRNEGHFLSLGEYRRVRELSIGVYHLLDMIELAVAQDDGFRPYRHLPLIQDARRYSCLLCAWVNDFFSFSKESAAGDPNNLLAVIMNEQNCTKEEAHEAALSIHREDEATLNGLIAKAFEAYPHNTMVHQYLKNLTFWPIGNYFWSKMTRRYNHIASALEAPDMELQDKFYAVHGDVSAIAATEAGPG